MILTKLIFYVILLLINIDCRFCYKSEFNVEDKLYLRADELVNLVAKENKITKSREGIISQKLRKKIIVSTLTPSELEHHVKTDYTNEDQVKRHKVWSRWGKWGDCSVTCGDGIISRRRVCVAGRCAPGEIEEQHRPCSRTACNGSNVTETFDLE